MDDADRIRDAGRHDSAGVWFRPLRVGLIVAILIAAAYPDVLFGLSTFCFRDYGLFGYPLAYLHRQSFLAGEIPLWNPLSGCGMPFLAQWNTLVFYPGSLLYLLFPVSTSLGYFCLFHLALAGIMMYVLARRWTAHEFAAAVAGVGYAINGLALNCLMWPNNIAAYAWLPAVVWLTERAWREGGVWMIWAALVGAVQLFSGAPEFILCTWLLVGFVACGDVIMGSGGRIRVLARLAGVAMMAAALAAVQLLPFLDLLRHSHRDAQFGANASWAMPATGWANFLAPLFQTHTSRQGVHYQLDQFWTSSYYVGIGLVLLSMLAVIRVRHRRVASLAAAALFALLFSLGDTGYIYPAILKLFPWIGFTRYPIKFVVIVAACAPLLAAFAVRDQALGSPAACRNGRPAVITAAVLLSMLAGIVWFSYYFPEVDEEWARTAWNGLGRAVFLVAIVVVWLTMDRWPALRVRVLMRMGLLALLGIDVVYHAPRQNPTVPRGLALQPELPTLQTLDPLPRHGRSRAMISPEAIKKFRYTFTSQLENDYLVNRMGLYNNCNLLEDIPKLDGFYSLYIPGSYLVVSQLYSTPDLRPPALLDFLGVSQVTAESQFFEWQARRSFMPFATAGQSPVYADDPSTFQALFHPDFRPREVVYLPESAQAAVGERRRTEATVALKRVSAHRVELDVQSVEPTVVVVCQTYYPAWHAYVDETREPLLRANHGFQAVPVPAGNHHVALVYKDPMFRAGAAISLSALAGCGIGLARYRRRQRPITPS